MSHEISSVENPRLRRYAQILHKGRLPDGTPVLPVEGPRLLAEALAGGWRPVVAAVTSRGEKEGLLDALKASEWFQQIDQLLLAPHVYKKLSETQTPQEPLVLVAPPDFFRSPAAASASPGQGFVLPPHVARLVVADGVQDPGNLGALLRSALAFGFQALVATPGTSGIASPKVLRASAGALFRLPAYPAIPAPALAAELRRRRFLVAVLDPRGDSDLDRVSWREPVAIVTGSETHGPDPAWSPDPSDQTPPEKTQPDTSSDPIRIVRVRIPISPQSESLNTGVAASLALYAASRALFPME